MLYFQYIISPGNLICGSWIYILLLYPKCKNTTTIIQGVKTTSIPPTYPDYYYYNVNNNLSLTTFIEAASHLSGVKTSTSHPSRVETSTSHPSGAETSTSHPSGNLVYIIFSFI